MRKERVIKYGDICDKLQTGDILNCEQKDLFWRLIGHAATVYRDPLTNMLFCLESTSISKISGISGVQLNPLGLWLKNYPGKIYLRQLVTLTGFVQTDFPAVFIEKYRTSSYPNYHTRTGRWKLILSALDINIFGKDIATYKGGDKGIFCTQLVVMFLRFLGIMYTDGILASEFEPDDFRDSKIDKYLTPKCYYQAEIRIK
jgi:hypothetical protein